MASLSQKLVPGVVGISTYVDCVYHKELQLASIAAAGTPGPINQLCVVTVTLDFRQLIESLRSGRLEAAEAQVAAAASALEAGGADFVVVTSGTTSTLTGRARREVSIPFLDLAAAALLEARAQAAGAIGLMSTRHAAAGGIFQAAAESRGAQLVLPSPATAERVDEVIFGGLILGQVAERSVQVLRAAIAELAGLGARSVILGNTDMTLAAAALAETAPVPLIDSARAHARAAARAALDGRI